MVEARLVLVGFALAGCSAAPQTRPARPPAVDSTDTAVDNSATASLHSGSISGVVTHRETNERLPRALVILQSTSLDQAREAQTSDTGLYAFGGLPAGTYTIQVLSGLADVAKVTTLPEAARFRANFSVDPDGGGFVCRLPSIVWSPQQSLFSVTAQEGKLLGVPETKIFR